MIDKFLIFGRCFFASMQPQIGFASYIGRMQGRSPFGREKNRSEFVGGRYLEKLDGFGGVIVIKLDGSANGGEPIPVDKRVERVASSQIIAHFLGLPGVPSLR